MESQWLNNVSQNLIKSIEVRCPVEPVPVNKYTKNDIINLKGSFHLIYRNDFAYDRLYTYPNKIYIVCTCEQPLINEQYPSEIKFIREKDQLNDEEYPIYLLCEFIENIY